MVKKKKPFIDKKKSTTYYLTYNGLQDEEEQAAQGAEGTLPLEDEQDSELAAMFGMASIYEDTAYELNDTKRREIISLGLPDDGYDYTQHLREPTRRAAAADGGPRPAVQVLDPDQPHLPSGDESLSEEEDEFGDEQLVQHRQPGTALGGGGAGGPSVFIAAPKFKAPGEDARLVDARALCVTGKAEHEADVDEALPTISAFTRTAPAVPAKLFAPRAPPGASSSSASAAPPAAPGAAVTAMALGFKGRIVTELDELEESMQELERDADSDEELLQQQRRRAPKAPAVPWPLAPPPAVGEAEGDDAGPSVEPAPRPFDEARVQVKGDKEWADWLDGFVVLASAVPAGHAPAPAPALAAPAGAADAAGEAGAESSGDEEEEEEGEEEEERRDRVGSALGAGSSSRGGAAGAGRAWDAASVGSRRPGSAAGRPGGKGGEGSIASTYWRPEREDRKEGLQGIDEQFEQVALQYDDDELGELEDDEQAAQARGTADIHQFDAVLDEFLQEERRQKLVGASGRPQAARAAQGGQEDDDEDAPDALPPHDFEDDEDEEDEGEANGNVEPPPGFKALPARRVEALDDKDEEVIAATRARLAAAAAAAAQQGGADGGVGGAGEALPDTLGTVVVDRGERWDCESVLSLRSNLENHPGRIVEPQSRTGGKGGARIELSRKTGMPVLAAAGGRAGVQGSPIAEEGEDGEGQEGEEDDDSDALEEEEEEAQGAGNGPGVPLERRKGETAEERRARKAAVKEAKRAGRAAKKELKGLFKSEAAKQKRQAAGRAAAGGGVGMGTSTYTLH